MADEQRRVPRQDFPMASSQALGLRQALEQDMRVEQMSGHSSGLT